MMYMLTTSIMINLFVRIVLLIFICATLTACDGGHNKPLDNNFYLHRSSDSIVMIFRNSDSEIPRNQSFAEAEYDIVVGARVSKYAILDNAIVGYVEDRPESPYSYLATPGWFYIDRETGIVMTALSQSDWDAILVKRGLDPDSVKLERAK